MNTGWTIGSYKILHILPAEDCCGIEHVLAGCERRQRNGMRSAELRPRVARWHGKSAGTAKMKCMTLFERCGPCLLKEMPWQSCQVGAGLWQRQRNWLMPTTVCCKTVTCTVRWASSRCRGPGDQSPTSWIRKALNTGQAGHRKGPDWKTVDSWIEEQDNMRILNAKWFGTLRPNPQHKHLLYFRSVMSRREPFQQVDCNTSLWITPWCVAKAPLRALVQCCVWCHGNLVLPSPGSKFQKVVYVAAARLCRKVPTLPSFCSSFKSLCGVIRWIRRMWMRGQSSARLICHAEGTPRK